MPIDVNNPHFRLENFKKKLWISWEDQASEKKIDFGKILMHRKSIFNPLDIKRI